MISELLDKPVVIQLRSVIQSATRRGQNPHVRGRHSDCMVYVRTGRADYFFGGYEVAARPGGVLYLAKGSSYRIDVLDDDYSYIFVDFDLPDAAETRRSFWLSAPELAGDFERLYAEWLSQSAGSRERSFGLLYRILGRLAALAEQSDQSADRRLLAPGVDCLNRAYTDAGLRLSDAAAACGCSDAHFRRVFRRVFGQTPQEYLTALRIRRAKELLGSGELTVTQAAAASGYGDVYYFCRVFKRQTGRTPGSVAAAGRRERSTRQKE